MIFIACEIMGIIHYGQNARKKSLRDVSSQGEGLCVLAGYTDADSDIDVNDGDLDLEDEPCEDLPEPEEEGDL